MIHRGDALAVLKKMPANSFEGCLTDPPYGLAFMGNAWDHGVPGADVWAQVLRVLKPGAYLLAFGGSRTYHRLTCAIEDAGFEIRDCIMWLYGQGFPKSSNISQTLDRRRDWEGLERFHAAVKTARAALGITQSAAARRCGIIGPGERLAGGGFIWYETGRRIPDAKQYRQLKRGLKLGDECDLAFEAATREVIGRTIGKDPRRGDLFAPGRGEYRTHEYDQTAPATEAARQWEGYGTALKPAYEPIVLAMKATAGTFARNAAVHGVAGLAIDASRIGPGRRWPANVILDADAGRALDAQSGQLTSGNNPAKRSSPKTRDVYGLGFGDQCLVHRGTDSGGASRFFYCPKASRKERGANTHPTVKPLKLTEYLARLILPPGGGRLLVPYAGSGSEMLGARRAGWTVTGIERERGHVKFAEARLQAAA